MNIKRITVFLICLIVLLAITAYGTFAFYNHHRKQTYFKILRANAIYENADPTLQKKIITLYEERLHLDFPDSTEVLFANAEKGDLFEETYIAFLKLRINSEDRKKFEEQFEIKEKKVPPLFKEFFENTSHAPKGIWTPKLLDESCLYCKGGNVLCIGIDEKDNIIIYINYATI